MENPQYPYSTYTLREIGNVADKLPKQRIITPYKHLHFFPYIPTHPLGIPVDPSLILKSYIMIEVAYLVKTNSDKSGLILRDIPDISMLIADEVREGRIKPLSGLGFLILSDGIANVCRWDTKYPDVIVPRIYTLENGIWTSQKVEDVGAFCSGEKRVYDHENKAWLQYLISGRTNKDILRYLNDFLVE